MTSSTGSKNSSASVKDGTRTTSSELGDVIEAPSKTEAKLDLDNCTRDIFKKKIDTKLLVCLTFFVVAASPVGIEPVVKSGGTLFGIIGIIVFPFIYSIPMAIMSSEMASIYPQAGGSIQWVQNINHYFGAVNSYLHILYNWVDNALYPVIMVDYIGEAFLPELEETGWRFLAGVIIFALVAVLNILGITIVGKAAIIFTVVILVPFFLFAGLSCSEFDISYWGKLPKEFDWTLYVSTLFWDMCGYDRISDTAEEVKNPTKTFPKALLYTVILVTLTYLLPTAFGIMVDPEYENWDEDYFVQLAEAIPLLKGSKWLSYIISICGALSQFGLLLAAISCCSRELFEMAEYRHIPGRKHVMKISKKNEPWVAIIIQSIISAPLIVFDFDFIMTIDGAFYGYVLILEYVSYFYSRFSKRGKAERRKRIFEAAKKEIMYEKQLKEYEQNEKKKNGNNDDPVKTESVSEDENKEHSKENKENKESNDNNDNNNNSSSSSDSSDSSNSNSKSENDDEKSEEIKVTEEDIEKYKDFTEEEIKIVKEAEKMGKNLETLAKETMFLMPGGTGGVILISVTPLILCVIAIVGNGLLVNVLGISVAGALFCYYFFSHNYRIRKYGREEAELMDEIELMALNHQGEEKEYAEDNGISITNSVSHSDSQKETSNDITSENNQ